VAFNVPTAGFDLVVERTLCRLLLNSDQQAVTETQVAAFGCIVVSEDAVAAGIASIPGPVSDDNADWLLHTWLTNRFVFADATGFINGGLAVMVDSKARRRVQAEKNTAFVFETDAVSAGARLDFGISQLLRVRGT
jgi:hypothetical protein